MPRAGSERGEYTSMPERTNRRMRPSVARCVGVGKGEIGGGQGRSSQLNEGPGTCISVGTYAILIDSKTTGSVRRPVGSEGWGP